MDNEGHLINVSKARGRKNSILALVDRMERSAIEPEKQTVFISHGDCLEDAEAVAQMVRERFGTQDIRINYVGPVIGNHSGPGTMALFFLVFLYTSPSGLVFYWTLNNLFSLVKTIFYKLSTPERCWLCSRPSRARACWCSGCSSTTIPRCCARCSSSSRVLGCRCRFW